MRPETIAFSEDMPVRACIRNITEYPYHWHKALEVIMVLKGQATIGVSGETHLLTENNIVVVNRDELHCIKGKDNKLLIVQIDSDFCKRTYPDFQYVFLHCCSSYHEAEAPEKYKTVKGHVLHLVRLLINMEAGKNHKVKVRDCLEETLACMIDGFDYLRYGSGIHAFMDKHVKRYRDIYEYVLKTPAGQHRLTDLAEIAGISTQHMSHDIKDKFGLSFVELLACGRCMVAARLLLSTGKMIRDISAECGFSDPKYLVKYFKMYYRYTPSEFRKKYKMDEETLASRMRYEEIPLSAAI